MANHRNEPYSPGGPEYASHLTAALNGSADEFSQLTEPHRRELQVHCYRILGSLADAEDMVQETFLRAWKRLGTFQERSSFRAWLYKIATNACLDALDKRARQRRLPTAVYPAADPHAPIAPPATEVSWLEPFPDEWLMDPAAINPEARYSAYESISLAFLAALQGLPPRQRAVLILIDVLDWSAQETADLLGASLSAVASALHRARSTMAKKYHRRFPEDRAELFTDSRSRELLDRYMRAWQAADVDSLVNLLRADAVFSMPPSPSWYRGRPAIREFLSTTVLGEKGVFEGKAAGRWRLLLTSANGEPAFAVYERAENGDYRPFGIHVLSLNGDKISLVTSFIDPKLPSRFRVA